MGRLTRSKMLKEYAIKYSHIPENKDDILGYLKDTLKLTDKNFENIESKIKIIKSIRNKLVEYKLYEIPMATDRARSNFTKKNFYVNNAKVHSKFITKKLQELGIEIDTITTQVMFILKFYLPTPSDMPKEERYIAELGYIRPLRKPDNDNVYKTYTDMVNQLVIMDDYIITDTVIRKFYSVKPRIEVCIRYKADHDSEYTKKKISKSKFFEQTKKQPILFNIHF